MCDKFIEDILCRMHCLLMVCVYNMMVSVDRVYAHIYNMMVSVDRVCVYNMMVSVDRVCVYIIYNMMYVCIYIRVFHMQLRTCIYICMLDVLLAPTPTHPTLHHAHVYTGH